MKMIQSSFLYVHHHLKEDPEKLWETPTADMTMHGLPKEPNK
jgi:hypothetical protein